MSDHFTDYILSKLKTRRVLTAAFNAFGVVIGEDFHAHAEAFKAEFDAGPYDMAKRLGVLRNNSAEDMAVEWMSFSNLCCMFPGRGY